MGNWAAPSQLAATSYQLWAIWATGKRIAQIAQPLACAWWHGAVGRAQKTLSLGHLGILGIAQKVEPARRGAPVDWTVYLYSK